MNTEILNKFKKELYNEIENWNNNYETLKRFKRKEKLTKEIIEILSSEEITQDNMEVLQNNLIFLYDEEGKQYFENIKNSVSIINQYKNNTFVYAKEINEEYQKLDKIFDFINLQNRWYNLKIKGLEQEVNNNKRTMMESKKILTNFQLKLKFEYQTLMYVKKLLNVKEYSDTDTITILELIREHNREINPAEFKYKTNSVLELLNTNYVKTNIPVIPENRKKDLDKELDYLKSSIFIENEKNIEEILPEIDNNIKNIEELVYIYKSLYNTLVDEMEIYKELLVQEEIYNDDKNKFQAVYEFNIIKNKINKLIDKLAIIIKRNNYEKKKEADKRKEENNTEINEETKNNIIFLERPNGDGVYFEKDLEKMPEESYETIERLLNDFENNKENLKSSPFKSTNNNVKDICKIKEGQIRIIYQHLSKNNYLFLGVGLKKDTNPKEFYAKFADRSKYFKNQIDQYFIIRNQEANARIKEYLDNNKRKTYR